MEMKTSSLIILAFVLSIIAGVLLKISSVGEQHRFAQIDSYEECAAAGNPILESYPSQCITPDGRNFVNPNEHVEQVIPSTPASQQYVQSGCVVGGCSGELCTEAAAGNMVSNCIYRAEFKCYKTARCERQASGTCGWTQTTELNSCIASAPQAEEMPQ